MWHRLEMLRHEESLLERWTDEAIKEQDRGGYWTEYCVTKKNAGILESSFTLSLPHSRRPTLSQYDNRRSEFTDRYYFGIYHAE